MKRWLKANRGLLVLLLGLGIFRTAIADWNPVPSGSMRPTILEGDVVFVNRLAYDLKVPLTTRSLARLGEPRRGDIVTFSSPADGVRLIKRVVATPGDVVEIRNRVLFINGSAAEYTDVAVVEEPLAREVRVAAIRATENVAGRRSTVQFLPRQGHQPSFGPVTVAPDGSWSFTQPTHLPDGTYYPVLSVTTNGVSTPSNLTPLGAAGTVQAPWAGRFCEAARKSLIRPSVVCSCRLLPTPRPAKLM